MDRGDIYYVSLEPTVGHEQQGQRPVVVLTTAAFNAVSGVPVVLPVTTSGAFARMRGFAVSLSGTGLATQGIIRCDRPRAIDLRARKARRSRERVPAPVMDDVLAKVVTLFE
jgi:mRNA-degrading endonuclease toxin of MazEF toxin-antitoxin module